MQCEWTLELDPHGAFISTKSRPDVYVAWFNEPSVELIRQLEELVRAHNDALMALRAVIISALDNTDLSRNLETMMTDHDD